MTFPDPSAAVSTPSATHRSTVLPADDGPMWGLQPAHALIHLDRLRGNLAAVRAALRPGTRVFAVVKADAYGFGLPQVATELSGAGIDGFVVSSTAEGMALRGLGLQEEMVVLGPVLEHEVATLVAHRLSVTLVSMDQLEWVERAALCLGQRVRAHVRVDIGLGCQGLDPQQLLALLARLHQHPWVQWASLFVQQAGGYRADAVLMQQERARLEALLQSVRQAGFEPPLVHSHSSPGVCMAPEAVTDGAVRIGALLYGLRMADLTLPGIRPVMEIHARVLDVRMLEAGSALSYEAGCNNLRRRRVAILSIGFATAGFLAMGASVWVLVRGVRLPLLGRPFMNNLLVDACELPCIERGDEAVLLGQQGALEITAEAIAAAADIRPSAVPLLCSGLPRRYQGALAGTADRPVDLASQPHPDPGSPPDAKACAGSPSIVEI